MPMALLLSVSFLFFVSPSLSFRCKFFFDFFVLLLSVVAAVS